MLERAVRRGVASLLLVLPVPLLAQGLNIDHKPVGCIVAEKYPKLNACFSPASQLARARVYFRQADGPPNWYYVEMKSEAPCHAGVLPKPKKQLIGKKVLYYVNAFDQKFAENRTVDNEALVVKSESECKKDVPVAPFATSAPAAVFPAVPAGFAAAGVGTATVVAAVGGAAVVGGGVALATRSNNNPPPTTQPLVTTPTTVPATIPTTTTTTQPQVPFNAVFIVKVGGVVQTSTSLDLNPFVPPQVEFDMCQSTGPGTLTFNVDVGETPVPGFPGPPGFPVTLGGLCNIPMTFTDRGISSPFRGFGVSALRPSGSLGFFLIGSYDVRMRVETAGTPGNSPKAHQDVHILMDRGFGFESNSGLQSSTAGRIVWASQLDVPEATGQVVINGAAAVFAGPGRSTSLATGRVGENRVEAQLVQGAGKPGTWRFDLPTTGVMPGSVRVLAGDVALLSGESVVFRLSGRPGERVVFSFRTAN